MRAAALGLLALLALAACGEEDEPLLPGERLGLRAGTLQEPRPVAAPRGFAAPAAVANADWTHRNGAPDHAIGHPALPGALALAFEAPIGEGDSRGARITADPVVAGGRVFTLDARATVTATSTSGQTLWTRGVVPPADLRTDASGGGLATDGATLYVTTGYGRLLALDAATGAPRWTQDLDAPASSSPTVRDGSVYVVARDGRAYALDAASGRIRWQTAGLPSAATFAGGAGAAALPDLVILPLPSGEVEAALPGTGLARWTTIVAGGRAGRAAAFAATDIAGDPVVANGTVYVANASGRLSVLDVGTGLNRWTAPEGAASPVWPAGDSVFLVNDVGELLRLDAATGAPIWRTALPQEDRRRGVTAHRGPVLAGGRLLVASSDGAVRQYDPGTGAPLGDIALPAGAASAPVVAGGTLYVVTSGGELLAFR